MLPMLLLLLVGASALPPTAWEPRGITGGGAFFSPGFHPRDETLLTATTDMGVVRFQCNSREFSVISGGFPFSLGYTKLQVFRSADMGGSWVSLPFGDLGGSRPAQVRFTDGTCNSPNFWQ